MQLQAGLVAGAGGSADAGFRSSSAPPPHKGLFSADECETCYFCFCIPIDAEFIVIHCTYFRIHFQCLWSTRMASKESQADTSHADQSQCSRLQTLAVQGGRPPSDIRKAEFTKVGMMSANPQKGPRNPQWSK
jgi:hypothetical protein